MTVDDPVLIIPCSDSSSVLICMRPQQMRTPMFADRLAGSSLKMSASTLSQELWHSWPAKPRKKTDGKHSYPSFLRRDMYPHESNR
jgi:hypothetical protein